MVSMMSKSHSDINPPTPHPLTDELFFRIKFQTGLIWKTKTKKLYISLLVLRSLMVSESRLEREFRLVPWEH